MERRVVVTGLGCVSPLGNDVASTWCGIREGKSGIDTIRSFDASSLAVRFGGEAKGFDPSTVLDRKQVRRMDRFQHMAIAAAREALAASGLEITEENAARVGVVVGSGVGGLGSIAEGFKTLYTRGPDRVSPFLITEMVVNLAAGYISILLGAKGPNYSPVSACATGGHAIGEAAEIIRRDQADVMLAGGAEAGLVGLGMAAFANMRALSTRNDEPQRASRPFDAERDGFVMAEGAGIVLLEELGHARARGAEIAAEIVGYGLSADASHITDPAPGGEGAARAMAMALETARMEPAAVSYINAHGTSTPVGDIAETQAIKTVFGDGAYHVPVSSTKSMTGHLLGAAGGLESIVCVLAIRDNFAPATINYEVPDPECDLDYVPNAGREVPMDAVMNNTFGFGGHNVSLIFKRFRD